MSEITQHIAKFQDGETNMEALFAVSYDELKRLAHSRLFAANLKQHFATESLLHESFFRLAKQKNISLADRRHFFAYASSTMRSIILDFVRAEKAERRGAGLLEATLHTEMQETLPGANDLENVHNALSDLVKIDADLARLVEMKFFGGLTELEIAEVLEVSERTVRRNWEKARAALMVLMDD